MILTRMSAFIDRLSAVALTTSTYNDTASVYDTYDYFIHPHWKQFGLIPDEWHYLVGIYITIVGITGIIGNSIVIWIFSTTRNLKTPSNMLLVNLALSDLIFSAVNGFPLLTISAFNRKWMWGNTACRFYGFIGGLFGLMSINTLAAISFDRYLNVVKPLSAAKNMTRRKAFMIIVVVWAWSLIWAVPPIFGWGAYVPEGFQTSCTFDYLSTQPHMRAYIFGLYIGGFVIPLIIICSCYLLILKAIRKHEIEMSKYVDKLKAADRSRQEKASMEIKVARVAMVIITLYILSWSPYATVALIGQFGPAEWVTPIVSEIPVMLAKACAMHNPIVYAFSHPKFREALAKRVPWLLCCCDVKPSAAPSSGTSNQKGKLPASRTSSKDSNFYGSEELSSVTNLNDSVYEKDMPDFSLSTRTRNNTESNQIIMELVRALVRVVTRSTEATPSVNFQPPSVSDGKQENLAKYLAHLLATGTTNKRANGKANEGRVDIPQITTTNADETKKY